jgi:hypothetical protein
MNQRDIYCSAMSLIAECGAQARLHADLKRLDLNRTGDRDGAALWRRIGQAVAEIQETDWQTRY